MPVRRLPAHPDLNHLKYQAKDLKKAHAEGVASAAQRLREFHPRFATATDADIFAAKLTLSDAQLAVAREAGFASWARLKAHVETPTQAGRLDLPHHERIVDAAFRRAVELLDAGDAEGLRLHLAQHPGLTRQRVLFEGGNYFRNPTLLEFVAENPVRHGTMPENIVAITKIILDAGVETAALNETLMLVATGSVARESGRQPALMELLCAAGAEAQSALQPATLHGELAAVDVLLARGARIDLPVAAALGRTEDFVRLLPAAGAETRHLAFAMAAQYGQVELVRMLLDRGEDPNRYHPPGGHAHCTALHQAAFEDNMQLAQLLIEHGARLDRKDVLWGGTPEGWARHGGKLEMAEYLRECAAQGRR